MTRFKMALAIAVAPCFMAFATTTFAATNKNSPAADVSPAERAKIEAIVHQYLIAKPEVLIEAMQVLQNRQMEQAKESVKQTQQNASRFIDPLFHSANDPVGGNPNGKLTVVEFFDYQCSHCVDMAPILETAIKANPDMRVVFKEWPIRGPMSEFAARAALAANKQGKYLEFHRGMFANTQPLTQEIVLQIAKSAGLDVDKLIKDMNDSSTNNQIKATMKLAEDLKLFGTPAFFIGKTGTKTGIAYVPGVLDQQQLQDAINKSSK